MKALRTLAIIIAGMEFISLAEFAHAQTDVLQGDDFIPGVENHVVPAVDQINTGLLRQFSSNPTSIATLDGQTFYLTENNVNSSSGGDLGVVFFFSGSSGRQLRGGSLTAGSSQFAASNSPNGVAVDSQGNVYVADTANNEVDIFRTEPVIDTDLSQILGTDIVSRSFTFVRKLTGSFNNPNGIAIDSRGNIYVADTWNNEIDIFYSNGTSTSIGGGWFNNPRGIAVDSRGNIYVADTGNNKVDVFNSSLNRINTLRGYFNRPTDVVVDSFGNVSVIDTGNREIDLFDSRWQYKSSVRGFRNPVDLTVDSSGKVYVLDTGFRTSLDDITSPNARIRILTTTPISTTNQYW